MRNGGHVTVSELMATYRDGTLNLDLLTAFCVSEDQDRLRQVLEQMGPIPPPSPFVEP